MSGETVYYFYGVTAHDDLPEIEGIDAEYLLEHVQADGVQAIYSLADAALFAADQGEDSVAILTELILKHHDIIDRLHRTMTILPAPFATIFAQSDALTQLLERQPEEWAQRLAHVEDCVEIGLKAYIDDAALLKNRSSAFAPTDTRSGKNYLLRKKAEADAKKERDNYLTQTLSRLHDQLSSQARAALVKPIQDASTSDGTRLALRSLYLVERQQSDQFQRAVSAFTQTDNLSEWLMLETDAGFAPYHFVGQLE